MDACQLVIYWNHGEVLHVISEAIAFKRVCIQNGKVARHGSLALDIRLDQMNLIGVVHSERTQEKRLCTFLENHTKYPIILMADLNITPPKGLDSVGIWQGSSTSRLGRVIVDGELCLGKYEGKIGTHTFPHGVNAIDYVLGPSSWGK